jgi:hypothetical protein
LVLTDNFPERTPASRVAHRQLEGAVGDTAAARRDVDTAYLDAVHQLVETAARLVGAAEHPAGRNAALVEDQLGGVHALVAHFVDLAGHGQARPGLAEARILLHQERGQPAVRALGVGSGPREQHHEAGGGPVGQPHLLP